ncbi:PDZ domain-containing protein [Liquorilactobacillus satsumensis]|uniref:PDZ domain-containing protein n=1 Tax=Liquorilactobacillus satsumensis TaxID=259059 RepID=UPI0021C28579|nr:PDZ domain-containing protein [Liquorilactobacillus satsumensis]MCP9328220.1 PDZ domain-containing protein [Liquorilactobacillus satsumensis]
MLMIKFILLWGLQPVFWFGFLATSCAHFLRIKHEREHYHVAINRDFYEGRHYLKNGFIFSLLGSMLCLGLGVVFPIKWIFMYSIAAILGIIFSVFCDAGLFFLLSACLLPIGVHFLQTWFPHTNMLQLEKLVPQNFNGTAFLLLCALFFLFRWLLLGRFSPKFLTPKIKQGKRGRKLASYNWRELTVVPLVVLIPGNFSQNLIPFWPLVTFQGQHYSFFVLPLLVSGSLCIWRTAVTVGVAQARKNAAQLLGFCLLGALITAVVSQAVGVVFLLLVLMVVLRFIRRYAKMKKQGKWYVETYNGIRVIAVRPNTPAAKMQLEPGDVILECNGKTVVNEAEFYAALKLVPTFCRLKVKTYAGELKIAESAIFANSPHEIGLVLFH